MIVQVTIRREPGGSQIAEDIRNILKHAEEKMTWECELLLMSAARSQHTTQTIIPALNKNMIVFSDRYFDATIAYQNSNIPEKSNFLMSAIKHSTHSLVPTLTLLFDIDYQTSLDRTSNRGKGGDRFENKGEQYFNTVREIYIKNAERDKRFKIIDELKVVKLSDPLL